MSFFVNPTLACDYYKIGHATKMQPENMEMVYSTWTARSNKHHPGKPLTVVFGYQYTIQRLKEFWDENFFSIDIEDLRSEFEDVIGLSFNPNYADFSKFEKLWKLGYLPLCIRGVPEGTLLPVGIPDHVIYNTLPEFAWLPQFIEDMWSASNWQPSTSATTAFWNKKLLEYWVNKTCDNPKETIDHMVGDFSLRGHTSLEAGYISGAGHLLSFDRTATIGSNVLINKYYNFDYQEYKIFGMGTPSLEHSVVEQGIAYYKNAFMSGELPQYMIPYVKTVINENWEINLIAEMCFILYLLTEVQPEGVMTYVADTYDYWGVVSKILPVIKDVIMNREGCFSIRPDSGDPVKIICGDNSKFSDLPEFKGTLKCLLDIFGSTQNSKGCEVLPSQIRMIYGDAITPEIMEAVGCYCTNYHIALNNLSFGMGAYSYQYVSRDTRGYAIKATDCIHKDFGEIMLYKEPKTDSGKKSIKGCVAVIKNPETNKYEYVDHLTLKESLEYPNNLMVNKFVDGTLYNMESFDVIKKRLEGENWHVN